MGPIDELRAENREQAGKMLAQKFVRTNFIDGIVVGMPHGGISVAANIAQRLNLPLEVMSCKSIKDPSNPAKSIGSITSDDVYFHDCPFGVPQDFIYFQTVQLRNEIRYDNEFYYGRNKQLEFTGKTVILVDDLLTSQDTLMAALMSIKKQRPSKVIVAVPFVEAEAARIIQASCDEFVFLKMKQHINSPAEFYNGYSPVDEWETRELLLESNTQLAEAG